MKFKISGECRPWITKVADSPSNLWKISVRFNGGSIVFTSNEEIPPVKGSATISLEYETNDANP